MASRSLPPRRTVAALLFAPLLVVLIAPPPKSSLPQPQPIVATAAPALPTAPPPAPVPTSIAVPQPTPAPLSWISRHDRYIPILMYHYIREVEASADPLGFRLSVRPERFAEQLAWLREQGYRGLRMSELARCLRHVEGCPPRVVALTFDDGYADNAELALPLLRRYGFPATFYIVSGFVGREGYVSWDELRRMRDSGMELGAHSVSHADLAALDLETARVEIIESRRELERRLGIEVLSFSYPAGSYTPALQAIVREAGFTSAVTTTPADRLEQLDALPRRRVLGGESLEGYAWYFELPSVLTR